LWKWKERDASGPNAGLMTVLVTVGLLIRDIFTEVLALLVGCYIYLELHDDISILIGYGFARQFTDVSEESSAFIIRMIRKGPHSYLFAVCVGS
jgi:hypothetical protein